LPSEAEEDTAEVAVSMAVAAAFTEGEDLAAAGIEGEASEEAAIAVEEMERIAGARRQGIAEATREATTVDTAEHRRTDIRAAEP